MIKEKLMESVLDKLTTASESLQKAMSALSSAGKITEYESTRILAGEVTKRIAEERRREDIKVYPLKWERHVDGYASASSSLGVINVFQHYGTKTTWAYKIGQDGRPIPGYKDCQAAIDAANKAYERIILSAIKIGGD